jgi:hypothetical protein
MKFITDRKELVNEGPERKNGTIKDVTVTERKNRSKRVITARKEQVKKGHL